MNTHCLRWLAALALAAPLALFAQENVCGSPGRTILKDPAGDATDQQPSHDVQKLSISQPSLGNGVYKIDFHLKMADLSSLPATTFWPVNFCSPAFACTDPGVAYGATNKFYTVRMSTVPPGTTSAPVFEVLKPTDAGITTASRTPSAAPGSTYSAAGLITIRVDAAVLGLTPAGAGTEQLKKFQSRITVSTGVVNPTPDNMPNDLAGAGEFTTVSPSACTTDTDSDGVLDANDVCPGTPSGMAVDAAGCPVLNPPVLSIGSDYGNPDTDGSFTLTWTRPAGAIGPDLLQGSSTCAALFSDDAEEPLVAGANSKWAGSEQWSSSVNPETGSRAYYIPDTAAQDEVLTQLGTLSLPPGTTTLTFDSNEDTELGFDFAIVRISTDNGGSFSELASFSGQFVGKRQLDLSAFAGQTVKLQFRMTSDLIVSAPGWYVDNISVANSDWTDIATTDALTHSFNAHPNGSFCYRVSTRFPDSGETGTIASPWSNVVNATVDVELPPVAVARAEPGDTVNEDTNATLSGVDSYDPNGDPISYSWTQRSGPAVTLLNANTATASFTAPAVCTDAPLLFRLTVSDSTGLTHSDDITVTVHNVNQPPAASAGADFSLNEGDGKTLSAAGSTDADDCQTLSYSWAQITGPAVTLANANTATPSFTAPSVDADTFLRFRLTVRDPAGASSSSDITVKVVDANLSGQNANSVTGDTKLLSSGGLSSLSLLVFGLAGVLGLRRRRY